VTGKENWLPLICVKREIGRGRANWGGIHYGLFSPGLGGGADFLMLPFREGRGKRLRKEGKDRDERTFPFPFLVKEEHAQRFVFWWEGERRGPGGKRDGETVFSVSEKEGGRGISSSKIRGRGGHLKRRKGKKVPGAISGFRFPMEKKGKAERGEFCNDVRTGERKKDGLYLGWCWFGGKEKRGREGDNQGKRGNGEEGKGDTICLIATGGEGKGGEKEDAFGIR